MSVRKQIIVFVTTIVVIVGWFAYTLAGDNRPVLGLDLQGGISVVKFPEEGQDLSTLDTATDIIRRRVDAAGVSDPEVSRQGNTIVVNLPGVKDRDRALELIGQTGELRFREVLGCFPPPSQGGQLCSVEPPPETLEPLNALLTDTSTPTDDTVTTVPGVTTETTVPAAPTETAAPDATTETTIAGDATGTRISAEPIAAIRPAQEGETTTTVADPAATTTVADDATTTTTGVTTTTVAPPTLDIVDLCDTLVESTAGPDTNPQWAYAREAAAGCYYLGPTIITGASVGGAQGEYDGSRSIYVVNVEFKNDDFIDQVAGPYVGKAIAIELDGVVQSAPVIGEGITTRNVEITGTFTEGEANDLAQLLRYGALPIRFDPAEETVQSVSPSLGKDQLQAGIVAGLIGLGLVMLYMIVYYRLLGLVVWVGLGLTGLLFFSLVSFLSANRGLTLTLAGVTGLIVSVGVTVDSYVIYFERLKDEVRSGKTIRSSLDTGFKRAFSTIIAADFVSLLGAAVLYVLAEGSVRGFAFFLGLSTIIDLIIARTVMYPMVSLMARRPRLVRMRGIGIAAGLDVPEVRV